MNPAQIKQTVFDKFNIQKLYFWLFLRVISTFLPLAFTWIFAKGVAALENGQELKSVVEIFLVLLIVQVTENLIRLGAKTRIHIQVQSMFIEIQEAFVGMAGSATNRVEIMQSIRNLTNALIGFVMYIVNSGMPGLVQFVSIPIILFLIDKKIFIAEVILIVVYLGIVYYYSKIYEKRFESLDQAHESFYTSILEGKEEKEVDQQGKSVISGIKGVENITLFQWVTMQDLIAIFQFIVVFLIAIDYINGTKQISDLVLIVGYTRESQGFLNSITSGVDSFMQVEAGVERLVETSNVGKTTDAISA